MFQYVLDLPIHRKLMLPIIIMLLGFLVAGGTYWQSVKNINASEQRQKSLDKLSAEVLLLKFDISKTLQYEKDFLWKKDASFLKLHNERFQKASQDLKIIQTNANRLQLSVHTQDLIQMFQDYQQRFSGSYKIQVGWQNP